MPSIFSDSLQRNVSVDLARFAEGCGGRTLLWGRNEALIPFVTARVADLEWVGPCSRDAANWVRSVPAPGGSYETIVLDDVVDRPRPWKPWLDDLLARLLVGGRLLLRFPRGVPPRGRRERFVFPGEIEQTLRALGEGEWHPLPAQTPGWVMAAWVTGGEERPRNRLVPALARRRADLPPPCVTVLMATRDRVDLLQEAMRSLATQTLANWQAVIVDDGSKDGTSAYLRRLQERDPRVTILASEGLGKAGALRMALPAAQGEFLLLFDDDDLLAPRYLELSVGALKGDAIEGSTVADGEAVVSDALIINDRGGIVTVRRTPAVHPRNVLRALLDGCYLLQPTVLFRRDALLAAGGFCEDFSRLVDYELWFRLFRRCQLKHLPLPLARVRRHAGNRRDASLQEEIHRFARRVLSKVRTEIPRSELFPDLTLPSSSREKAESEAEAASEMARALQRVGLYREAEEELTAALCGIDANVHLSCLLARVRLGLGRRDEAEAMFARILAQHPGDGNALNGYGLCLVAREQWPEAEDVFARAVRANPNHLVSRVNWLWACARGELPPEVEDFHRGMLTREDHAGMEYSIVGSNRSRPDGEP